MSITGRPGWPVPVAQRAGDHVAVELQPVLGAREPRPATYDRLLYAISL